MSNTCPLILALSALTFSFGCTPTNACAPGETQACLGEGRCPGVQVCEAEGQGWGACDCGPTQDMGEEMSPITDATPEMSGDLDVSADLAPSPQELKAFPTAFGAGAAVTGGRAGQVIAVTRLDDAHDESEEPVEGTLRYALTRRFPRTIVFRVSGTIVLGDRDGDGQVNTEAGPWPSLLALESQEYGDFTVAGQTAPEGGVSIRGAIYMSGVHNMIWRYVRVRVSDTEAIERFAAFTARDCNHVIVDHVSSAYGGQQALSITTFDGAAPQDAVTVQFSLLSLAKNGSIMGAVDGPSGTTTVHNNFYTHLTHRVPNLAGPQSYEVINNVTYDWRWRLITVHNALTLNHISNAYVAGPHTAQDLDVVGNKVQLGISGTGDARIYTADNFISFLPQGYDLWDAWGVFQEDGTRPPLEMRVSQPFARHPYPIGLRTTARILEAVPQEAGAWRTLDEDGQIVTYRDDLDARLLEEYGARTSTVYGRPTQDFFYPTIPSSEPYPDADADGMPDAWERAHGHDPAVDDGTLDADGDGYTNLEEFLGQVDLATVYD